MFGGLANDVRFLINMPDNSGLVAEIGFDFTYKIQVPDMLRCRPVTNDTGSILFLKMVQSEEFAYHHDKDLDKHVFSVKVENAGLSFEKRLFFNKSSLQIGFINIKQGDTIQLTFCVVKNGGTALAADDAKAEEIQVYKFRLEGEYLIGASDNCSNSAQIQLITWAPTQIGVTLNYDGISKDFIPKHNLFSSNIQNTSGINKGITTVSGPFRDTRKT